MMIFKIVTSCVLFLAGWILIYKPSLIVHLNRVARDVVFNDRLVLLKGKKLAVLFFCLAMVSLYSGLNELSRWIESNSTTAWALHSTDYLMYMALQDYSRGKYPAAIEKYQKVLLADPMNTEAMKQLACTYTAIDDKIHARAMWKKLVRINPHHEDIRGKIEK